MARDIVGRVFNDDDTHVTLYLRTDPSECLRRMHVRGRPEECDHVTLKRMQDMHALHESMFASMSASSSYKHDRDSPVIYTIDANRDVSTIADEVMDVIDSILMDKYIKP
jgi:thymidylate kinase